MHTICAHHLSLVRQFWRFPNFWGLAGKSPDPCTEGHLTFSGSGSKNLSNFSTAKSASLWVLESKERPMNLTRGQPLLALSTPSLNLQLDIGIGHWLNRTDQRKLITDPRGQYSFRHPRERMILHSPTTSSGNPSNESGAFSTPSSN